SPDCQQAFCKIANFVVKSRLRFARNSYFSRKFKVTKFATSQSAGTLGVMLRATVKNELTS
ncbi:hypothetical protein, partial [Flavobacterium psychrophilum]|uniref:hypothetical protein n=1 Tax=Flavobacterium psychrophilum TaxID=96345 RepID=UPI001A99DE93